MRGMGKAVAVARVSVSRSTFLHGEGHPLHVRAGEANAITTLRWRESIQCHQSYGDPKLDLFQRDHKVSPFSCNFAPQPISKYIRRDLRTFFRANTAPSWKHVATHVVQY